MFRYICAILSVHRPNLKLAGLGQMTTIVLVWQGIQQPNSTKYAVRIISK